MLKHLKLLITTLSLLVTIALSAQIPSQGSADDLKLAAANLRPYFVHDGLGKSYPLKGYKPFYISHFGRHGSRYLSGPKYIQPALDCFDAAKAEGLLTERGAALHDAMKAISQAHQGMYGELAPLGAREHRALAGRMYDREKSVFSSRSRTRVRCVSSVYTRCLVSMANFTEELASRAPSLDITYLASKRYNDEYLNVHSEYNFKPEAIKIVDSLKRESMDVKKILPLYFTDTERVRQLIPNLYEMGMSIYFYWGTSLDLDFLDLDLSSLIPSDFIKTCGAIENAYRFATVSVSEEFGEHSRIAGEKILKDIVTKADEALQSDSDLAADLRFAHDSGLLPTCQLLGLEGFPTYTIRESHKDWSMAAVVPMCANLQMVFYKGKDDVLVRIMLNEKPAVIPAMTPVHGIYYRWDDIRNHIMNM